LGTNTFYRRHERGSWWRGVTDEKGSNLRKKVKITEAEGKENPRVSSKELSIYISNDREILLRIPER